MPKSIGSSAWLASCILALFVMGGCNITQNADAHPDQPINFSHKIHAGDNQIPCMYCHQSADKSSVASVPSVGTCMNCHKVIPGSQNPQEVTKVREFYAKRESIPWNRVHDLPDFVHFPHKRHVKYFMDCAKNEKSYDKCGLAAGQKFTEAFDENSVEIQSQQFTCSQCHGPVWTFGTGQRVEPLNMGWCVDCHRARIEKAPAEQQKVVHSRMMDCWTCHK